uniref:Potassium channel voltage dependent KCNQ C-terminal domain-containing protein n=1 Tax=Biomphalaria glabrata TaxID=6526 RepID=A0A2C9KB62_BIOGL
MSYPHRHHIGGDEGSSQNMLTLQVGRADNEDCGDGDGKEGDIRGSNSSIGGGSGKGAEEGDDEGGGPSRKQSRISPSSPDPPRLATTRVNIRGLLKRSKTSKNGCPGMFPHSLEVEYSPSSSGTYPPSVEARGLNASVDKTYNKMLESKVTASRLHGKTSLQARIYNFLERPTGWKCFIYHFTVFMMVLICLIFSVLSTIDQYTDFAMETLFWMITVMTIGYGDKVPQTWLGKIVASCFAVFAISFFALPAGILGSGFALKVQQKQRQKHFNRQIPAAATLIQCLWRCHAAEPHSNSEATWRIHIHDPSSEETVFTRMARRASLSLRKRRMSRLDSTSTVPNHLYRESMSSSMSYADERMGKMNKSNRKDSHRTSICVGESNANDDTDYDQEEPEKVQQLTEPHKTAIRVIRKIKYFVSRRKFQQARKPYDVRDVIEQYSQGHLNMMVRIKELQRRLDQTLGKPSSLYTSNSRDREKMTIGARMVRVETQVNHMDKKMDQVLFLLNALLKSKGGNEESKEVEV